jgi:hypothetical protein
LCAEMSKRIRLPVFLILLGLLAAPAVRPAAASETRWHLDLEGGAVFSGYNDVRIPGDTGTLLSFTDDLETDTEPFGRLRAGCRVGDRTVLELLVAPLRLAVEGSVDRPVRFVDVEFPAGVPLSGTYRFDSYRLTYRRDLVKGEKFRFGLGLTAKVRDAAIRLEGGGLSDEKKNTGFVPLINFKMSYALGSSIGMLLEGDALAAPQGRAEDVLAALTYELGPEVGIKAGYRLLEGGADNDEVYSFALFHYVVAGVTVRL